MTRPGYRGLGLAAACVAALGAIAACNDSSDATPQGSGGSVGGTGGAATGGSAGADTGGTAGSTAGTGGAAGQAGTGGSAGQGPVQEECLNATASEPPITLWASRWSIGTSHSSNAAVITQFTADPRRCQWEGIDDHCIIYKCLVSDWTGDAATMLGYSAGTVTVSNGGALTLNFVPDANGIYDLKFPAIGWSAGDTVTFAAQGGEIPEFTQTVGFPDALTDVQVPLGDAGAAPEIDRSVPLEISWTATDGKVFVDIAQKPTLNETWDRQELMCFFDGSAGTATISVEALQHVDADPALHSGIGVSHQAQQCSTLAGFHLWAALQEGQWWEAAIK